MNMYQGDDRVRQVNWLNQEAVDILNYDQDGSATAENAEELVAFWEANSPKPEWFDTSDRNLLVKRVAENLSR